MFALKIDRLRIALGFAAMLTTAGCATNPRDKIYQNMLIAGAVGVIVGQQKDSFKNTHSVMYAGVAASIAAAITLYKDDPYKESIQLKEQVRRLKDELDEISSPKLKVQTPGTFNARVPDKYQRLINPGEWRVYEVDKWVEDGENRMIHQDKMMELIPPSLRSDR